MKAKKRGIELFVITNQGTRCPHYWDYRWVIGADPSAEWAFFRLFTPPRTGQVIRYKEEYFCPHPDSVELYLTEQLTKTNRDWSVGAETVIIHKMFYHFVKHCDRARARRTIAPMDLVIRDPELRVLWAKFAFYEQSLFKDIADDLWNSILR